GEEARARERGVAGRLQPRGERVRPLDAAQRYLAQALGSEGGDVHRCHQGGELVVRADVRLRLAAADVLLARLEREDERAPAVDVRRLADDPAGELPEQLLAHDHEPEGGPAEAGRVAEGLAVADGDVG